jgi:malonate decarboxylase delta subunit
VIEKLTFSFPSEVPVMHCAHVGVVASGDLEILLEPALQNFTVHVLTNVPGHKITWEALFFRFFELNPYAMSIEINDHGATPGIVRLRLEQALELSLRKEDNPLFP